MGVVWGRHHYTLPRHASSVNAVSPGSLPSPGAPNASERVVSQTTEDKVLEALSGFSASHWVCLLVPSWAAVMVSAVGGGASRCTLQQEGRSSLAGGCVVCAEETLLSWRENVTETCLEW